MKSLFRTIFTLAPVAFLMGPISADPAPQPPVIFTQGLQGTFAADWQGVAGRIYFMQWSTDLIAWQYAPFLDFGDGMHSRGFASSTDKFFVRLFMVDFPEIASLAEAQEADFDGDGFSNLFELTVLSTSPWRVDTDSNGIADGADSPDGDSVPDAWEMFYFGNLTTVNAGNAAGYQQMFLEGRNPLVSTVPDGLNSLGLTIHTPME